MYEGRKLKGGIKLYDYDMTLFGKLVPTGGGGALAVSLLHKKEHIARDLVRFFFEYYRKKESPLAILWPFRPDFYRRMGCGLGAKSYVYKVRPSDLPKHGDRSKVRFLSRNDLRDMLDCYNRYAATTNGMVQDIPPGREALFDFFAKAKHIGYYHGKTLKGFAVFQFEPGKADHFLDNDITVTELVYETPESLAGLLAFFHSQFDQIAHITFRTADDSFHHLFADPRHDAHRVFPPVYHETNMSGVGIMYRVLNCRRLFEVMNTRNFGGQTLRLKLTIRDSFLPHNQGTLVIHFDNGAVEMKGQRAKYDVELAMDVAELSSLIMGVLPLKSLWTYGQAEISDPKYIDTLNRLFTTDHKPVCTTPF